MEINDLKNKILEKLKESSPGGVDVASMLQKDTPKVKDTKNTSNQEWGVAGGSTVEFSRRWSCCTSNEIESGR